MIKNLTKKTSSEIGVTKANSLSKIKGLIGENLPAALFIKTRFGIHTFFMKFPIDIVILDNKNRVVFLKKALLPWGVFFWNIKYDSVLELPSGYIKKLKLELGDMLEFNL